MKHLTVILSLLFFGACADITGADGKDGKNGIDVDPNLVPKAWSHSTDQCELLSSINLEASRVRMGECHYTFLEPLPRYNNDAYVVNCSAQEVGSYVSEPLVCFVSDKTTDGFTVNIYNLNKTRVDGAHDIFVMAVY